MSKRDDLKKLRSQQKGVRSEDTPAENYSINAAKMAAIQNQPVEKVMEPQNIQVNQNIMPPYSVENTIPSPVYQQTTPAPTVFQVEPPAETIEANPAASYSIANEPGKRISVSLRTENKNWMHRTAMRCGLSIQDYVNILIKEAWEREQVHPYIWDENDPLPERIPSNQTVLVAIKLTNVNIDRTKRMRASHCMTMTYYMNYLIEQEILREQTEGMRKPIFDLSDE